MCRFRTQLEFIGLHSFHGLRLAMLHQIWQKGLADGEQAPREGAAPAGLIENGIARDGNARRPEAEPPATPRGSGAETNSSLRGFSVP